ncbi:biliverdin-producing heme oxygenase [Sphingomonas sp. BK235]|uniref:biliverdin-producing heme oxygenase n=1 Tax=Sphingomonas sp. BK235 TaxID=2512131 RepID=UPI0010470A38|nr:biliverdin-producing heme oxygenase [Sphingomonas sp. BK235]TCP36814.1 heme oxygenase [Sphingomonas sp. BK235]
MTDRARPTAPPPATRTQRLRDATAAAHRGLDAAVMALDPFASRAHYARLLAVHHGFHRDVAALYASPELAITIPDLAARGRAEAVEQDMADLAVTSASPAPPAFAPGGAIDRARALGWLYVAEGSSLGAALLLKAVAPLGLDAGFGARHLAGHPEGRAAHWRSFTAALDAATLHPDEEARAVAGAHEAFAAVQALVDRERARAAAA